jgi:hypothetical protein
MGMKSATILRLIWTLAGIGLVMDWSRDAVLRWPPPPRLLASEQSAGGNWFTGEFVPNGAYEATAAGLLPAQIPNLGSWAGSDDRQGRGETVWFRDLPRTIHVAVAGYPQKPGCSLWAEFRLRDDSIARVKCDVPDPREQWNVWSIARPGDALAMRLVGEDRATGIGGWIAFSHPYRAWQSFPAWYQLAQLFATLALALTLIWGPGLVARQWIRPTEIADVILLGAGPLLLASGGLVIWCASGIVAPRVSGLICCGGLWLALGSWAWRRSPALELTPALGRALALSALIAAAVVAKSSYSLGPEGELFRGTISRNLTIGDRIDARYPFYLSQAISQGLGPTAPATERFFFPWTFFSRGPLAGLATVPIVFGTDGRPPEDFPDQRWSPFDPFGFAAYRITMIVLASGIIVALFLLLQPLVSAAWALIGAGLLALSPFGVHEVMFTWPKWAGTTGVLCSFMLIQARRPFAGGLALATGYLFHPLALLWAPWLGLWACARSERRWQAVGLTALRFGSAVALLVGPWLLAGQLAPHQPTTPFAGQGGFLEYFRQADRAPATLATWLHSRWMNFANTFIPAHAYFSDYSFNHFRANSTYGPSGRLVKFALLWWTSRPFGLGLALWTVSLGALTAARRSLGWAIGLFVLAPGLLITAYWGWDPLGVMRECGHPLFVAIIAVTCVAAARSGGLPGRLLAHPLVPWLQLPETWLMLWLTALLNPTRWPVEFAQLDPGYLVINAAALLATAALLQRVRRSATLDPKSVTRPAPAAATA